MNSHFKIIRVTRQNAYLDVHVFKPFEKCYLKESLTQCWNRTRNMLGFSTSGGLGPAANIIDYRLASLTAEKKA